MVAIDEIRTALDVLYEPDQIIELRALGERVYSGYYSDREQLITSVEKLDTVPGIYGMYVTVNQVLPDLLSRRVNRTIQVGKNDATTSDNDIIRRRWLLIDIDPTRPSGISASEDEHNKAIAKVNQIASWLHDEYQWRDPLIADSGNGAHLLYRVDLPNDEEATDLIKRCLQSIAHFWDDAYVTVDQSVFNAARIWKLYGTVSRKGDDTESRPHRTAKILEAPKNPDVLTVDQVKIVSDLYTVPKHHQSPPVNNGTQIDLGSWLQQYGLGYTDSPYQGGTLYKLHDCPFSSSHSDGAFAIQFPNGAIFAGCHHNSCGAGSQRWRDLREMYEPRSLLQHQRSAGVTGSTGITGNTLTKTDLPPLQTITDQARGILSTKDPIAHMIETAQLDHIGDNVPLHCMIMSLASRAVLNCQGLHVSITGDSGDGKSHVVSTFLKQVPDNLKIADRLSDKALFYTEIQPSSVIVLDDMSLSDQMSEVLKGITTSFQTGFVYRTVNKNREGQKCEIPPRCVWWLLKVEGAGDDQVWNRMLTCWIDDSEDQDLRVLNHFLKQNTEPPRTITREGWYISQAIWTELLPAWVIIPFADRIRFRHINNRRNPEMFLDLVKSHAIMFQFQRPIEIIDGVRCVSANQDDFEYAAMVFDLLHSVSGGQQTKLTKRESDLIAAIIKTGRTQFTVADLQRVTGLSNSVIRKLICGYSSHNSTYTGLLDKTPALSYFDQSVSDPDVTRHARVYSWDPELYDRWIIGSSVWLDRGNQEQKAEESGRSRKVSATKKTDLNGGIV